MVSFGNASGAVEPLSIFKLTPKNLSLQRPNLYNFFGPDDAEGFRGLCRETLGLLAQGVLRPNVSRVLSLEQAAQALEDLQARRTTGKLLLRVGRGGQ